MKPRIIRTTLALCPLAVMLGIVAYEHLSADSHELGDYAYRVPVRVTNETGRNLSNEAVCVTMNAPALIAGGFLQSDLDDLRPANAAGDAAPAMAQDIDRSEACWWLTLDTLPQDQTRNWYFHMGNATATGDQSLWLQASDSIDIPDADSLDITSNLIVESLGVNLAELPSGEACLLCKAGAYELTVDSTGVLTARVRPVIALEQLATGVGTTVNFSAPRPGNILIAASRATNTIPGQPAGWTTIEAAQVAPLSLGMRIVYKVADGTETSVSFSNGAQGFVLEYSGIAAVDASAINTTASGVTSLSTGSTATTSADFSLALAFLALSGNQNVTFTNGFERLSLPFNSMAAAARVVNIGQQETTASWSGPALAIAAIAVFTPIAPTIATTTIEAGTEYDIAMTTDGSQLTLWVDDVAVDTATFTDDIAVSASSITIDGIMGTIGRTRVGTVDLWALHFDGDGDYVTVPANIFSGLTAYTVIAVFRWDGTGGGTDGRLAVLETYPQNWAANMWIDRTTNPVHGTHRFITETRLSNTDSYTVAGPEILANQWYIGAHSWQRGVSIIQYLDGVKTGETPVPDIGLAPVSGFRFGTHRNADNRWFGGDIEAVLFYANTVLSGPETVAAARAYLRGDEAGLAGLWRMDEGEGTVLHDATANANHGTIIGATWVQLPRADWLTSYVLDLTYEPTTVSQTQQGDAGNGWTYTGTIANQATDTPDATYTFVRDTDGIVVAVLPLQTKVPLPSVLIQTDLANAIGDLPDLTGREAMINFPGRDAITAAIVASGADPDAVWFLIMAAMGVVFGAATVLVTKQPWMGLLIIGSWVGFGGPAGLYSWWVAIMATLACFGVGGTLAFMGVRR